MNHMKNKKWLIVLIGVGALLLGALAALVVLGLSDNAGTSYLPTYGYGYPEDGVAYESAMDMPMAMPALRSESADNDANGTSLPDLENRKIVRTANLTIRTRAFEEAQQTIMDALDDVGGYAENLYESGEVGDRRTELTLRVPSARLDIFLTAISGAGRVTSRTESAVDKTTQYQDNAARLGTLYQKRERLEAMLQKADIMADLIEIESAIADTQYEIDRYETYQRGIDKQVDMSTVNVTLREEKPTVAVEDESLWQRMKSGFLASVEGMGEFLQGLSVFLISAIPVVVPLAIVVFVIVKARKARKARKAKKAENTES